MSGKINSFVKYMGKKKLRMALAESVTCGMAAHKLATCKGVADVLVGSLVCYSPELKMELMSIPKKMIDNYTCESMQVTEALARNLKKLVKADIHAALTGLASEGGSETPDKPVGTVFFCMTYKNKLYRKKKIFRGSPLKVRKKACLELYRFIQSKV